MELTRGERAALALVVKSGRALVLASQLNIPGSDGRLDLPAVLPRREDYEPGDGPGILEAESPEPVEPTTTEGLRDRGLVHTWTVGVVVVFNRDEKRKLAVKQVVATLTPIAAKLMGVKLVEKGLNEVPRWADEWEVEEDIKVLPEGSKYPEPYRELVAPPEEKRSKRGRRAG